MTNERTVLRDHETAALKALVGLGLLSFAAGCYWNPSRAWADLLIGNFYFVSLSLAALCFIAIQYLSSAGWSVAFRRVPEAMAAYLPVGAAVGAVLILGIPKLYIWAHAAAAAADPVLREKAAYLNRGAFTLRTAAYFAAWLFFYGRLTANSRAQDASGNLEYTRRNAALSAVYLVVFALTFTLAAVDWMMSLEPRWYSTIYPWYLFSGAFVAAPAAMALLILAVRNRGVLKEIHEAHFHDLGKYVFAFSIFWAYLWFSQFLLIWYTNIPEETTFYLRRLEPGWRELFWLNPIVNFAAPFFLLLKAGQKKSAKTLLRGAAVVLIGHWLDVYLLAMPSVEGASAVPRLMDIAIFAGFAAAFLLRFDRAFSAAAPMPARDPFIEESLAL